MQPVTVYSKSTCPFCVAAKRLLQSKGVDFVDIDLLVQPNMRAEMIQKAGGQSTVPQIFIGDTHVGGCDDLHSLESNKKLDQLLAG